MSCRIRPWLIAILAIATSAARVFAEPTPIACGETQVHALGPGLVELTFVAQPGEVVSATVVPAFPVPGFIPRWRIKDAEGHRIQLSSGSHSCIGRCQTEPLPAGGTFTLRVADSGVGVGVFVISLEAVSATANGLPNGPPLPACARTVNGQADGTRGLFFGQSVNGTIDPRGDTDTFTVIALPGVLLGIELTRTGGEPAFAPIWDAFDPLGRNIGHGAAGERVSITSTGVVTILVADAEGTATGTYTLSVGPGQPSTTTTVTTSTTSTTGDVDTTTSTSPGQTTTTVGGTTTTGGETTTTVGGTTTTGGETTTTVGGTTTTGGETTTTVDVTTTTAAETTTTSTTASPQTTTTGPTIPGSTTTTLPPVYDLGVVLPEPPLGTPPMLGRALAAGGGHLVVGAAHGAAASGSEVVQNAGTVFVIDVSGAIGSPDFGTTLILDKPSPVQNDEFGAAIAVDWPTVVVGAPTIQEVYVFPNAPDLEARPPIGPPVDAGDVRFGESVAIAGDLIVVGAPSANDRAGIVYVFERATGAPHAVLTVPGPAGARLGASMASSGIRVLVGAPGNATVPGRAFLFDAASGALLDTCEHEGSTPGDEFGAAVALSGDSFVIGAPGWNGGRGLVAIYNGDCGTPSRTIVPPSPVVGERFGAAVAVEDDLLAVGAPGAVRDGVTAGAVYVFDVGSGGLEDTLEKPMPQADDAFGSAVAIEDGRVFSGAPGDDAGTPNGGTTFAFEDGTVVAALRERLSRSGFGEALAAGAGAFYVGAPDGADGRGFVEHIASSGAAVEAFVSPNPEPTRFGASIAAIGSTIVIGAPETAVAGVARVGAVQVWPVGSAAPSTIIANPDPQEGDQFGFAVGDVDGAVLASAPFAGETDTGLVYRLDVTTGQPLGTYGKPTPTGADFFGADVAGDAGQVLVGAPLDAGGGAPAGAVYLFDAEAATIAHAIPNPNGTPDLFGSAVALGQWIAVGAPLADDGLGGVGTVWVFDRATGSLIRKVENPSPGSFDSFGASVALLGEQLIVGAPRADDNVLDAGLVYVFDADGGLLQTLRSPPQGFFDNFGFAVATNSLGVLVGSPGPGRVYLFDPIASPAGAARAVARLLAATTDQCGNGLVEEPEQCDDGNDVDMDDCRSDCTRGPCCTLDALASRCDDGNPCTNDVHDPVIGCRYEPSGRAGCCQSDDDCGGQQCRLCVGCFLFDWDCCATGSQCIPSNPECAAKTCLDAAFCQCAGKLDCAGEAIPNPLREPFDDACNVIRLAEQNVEPDGTPVTKEEIVAARRQTRSARVGLKKTAKMARTMRRDGQISPQCRKSVAQQVRVVRKAIPRGKKLRRCLKSAG